MSGPLADARHSKRKSGEAAATSLTAEKRRKRSSSRTGRANVAEDEDAVNQQILPKPDLVVNTTGKVGSLDDMIKKINRRNGNFLKQLEIATENTPYQVMFQNCEFEDLCLPTDASFMTKLVAIGNKLGTTDYY